MTIRTIRHPRYMLFLAVLLAAGSALALRLPLGEAFVAGFDLGVLVFLASCIPLWRKGHAAEIRRQAERDDAGQWLLLILTGLISSVVLVAQTSLLAGNGGLGLPGRALLVLTLIASWTFTNLIFAFHYARLYYAKGAGGDRQGLDFPGGEPPDFSDFVNFAFVIGMTCQTADIAITQNHMRRVSTVHGFFAFVFNLGILALTVNVIASSLG